MITIFMGAVMTAMPIFVQANAERLDALAAIVNGEAVTCYEVHNTKESLKKQLRQQKSTLPAEDVLYQRALDTRVMRVLQHQEAQKLQLHIEDAEIAAAIADVESKNKLQPGQLKEVLEAQGVDMISYRETLEDRLLSSRLINLVVRSKLTISEESMREYYRKHLQNPKAVREVRLAQLFLAVEAGASASSVEAMRKKAQRFHASLQHGADFLGLVALNSDAPDASSGGDMGWVSPGAVSGAFEQVFQRGVGEITDVIRSSAGFHIIKVTEERLRKPENTKPYKEVHARHILIQVPDSATLDTQVKIHARVERIAKEMQNTSDEAFAVRAKELSQGPSASQGGDLGWFKRGQMVAAFEEVAFAMQPGETSGVVTSQFGLHVVRLVDKRTVNPNAFEARKAAIEKLLKDSEMRQQVPRWLNGLKATASIVHKSCAALSHD